jgi:hypothetical protein
MTAHQHNSPESTEIAIRSLSVEDRPALERLAQLDSAGVPDGHLLGAMVGGELVAVASVETGRSIADPFVPSDELRVLLAERVSQLRGRGRGRPSRGLRRLVQRRPARSPGTVGGSPPGAGGRLLKLS